MTGNQKKNPIIRQEAVIASKIITLRNEKVILDVHLADIEIDTIRKSISEQNQNIQQIFDFLQQLELSRQQELDQQNRKRIGYNR